MSFCRFCRALAQLPFSKANSADDKIVSFLLLLLLLFFVFLFFPEKKNHLTFYAIFLRRKICTRESVFMISFLYEPESKDWDFGFYLSFYDMNSRNRKHV